MFEGAGSVIDSGGRLLVSKETTALKIPQLMRLPANRLINVFVIKEMTHFVSLVSFVKEYYFP
mgnify:CR=1 FL=1